MTNNVAENNTAIEGEVSFVVEDQKIAGEISAHQIL